MVALFLLPKFFKYANFSAETVTLAHPGVFLPEAGSEAGKVAHDPFLKFILSELGGGENALRQIFSTFVLEDELYSKKYKEG